MSKLKLIVISLLAVTVIAAGWLYTRSDRHDETVLTLYGNIDIRQVDLGFHDPEHIKDIYVLEGERVKQGQLLAVQDPERFQYAVDIAEAVFEVQQQALNRGTWLTLKRLSLTLALIDPVWVGAYVSEQDLGRLRPGMTASISNDSYPGKQYSGWIGYISPTTEFTPKSFQLKAAGCSFSLSSSILSKRQIQPCTSASRHY